MTDAELIAELERLYALALEVDDTHPTLAFARAAYEHAPRLLALAKELERTRVLCQSWHDDAVSTQKMLMEANAEVERLRAAVPTIEVLERVAKANSADPAIDDLSVELAVECACLTAANKALVEAAGPFAQSLVAQTSVEFAAQDWRDEQDDTIVFIRTSSQRKGLPELNDDATLCVGNFRALSRAVENAAPALGGDDASATVPECSE